MRLGLIVRRVQALRYKQYTAYSSENIINIWLVTVPLEKVRKHLCLWRQVGEEQRVRK